jgi:hypothetical protein
MLQPLDWTALNCRMQVFLVVQLLMDWPGTLESYLVFKVC